MTVSYRMSMTDTWQYLSYLSTRTLAGRFFLALVLGVPLIGPVSTYHAAHTASLHHMAPSLKMQHLMVLESWFIMAGIYITFLFSGLLGLYLRALIIPKATITIDSETWCLKTFMTVKA